MKNEKMTEKQILDLACYELNKGLEALTNSEAELINRGFKLSKESLTQEITLDSQYSDYLTLEYIESHYNLKR